MTKFPSVLLVMESRDLPTNSTVATINFFQVKRFFSKERNYLNHNASVHRLRCRMARDKRIVLQLGNALFSRSPTN